MTKPTYATIKFTAVEIATMRAVMMLNSNKISEHWQQDFRVVAKEEELTALETFKELGKAIKNKNYIDSELSFGTEQKAILIKFLSSYPFPVSELEMKYSLLERLK